MTIKGVNFHLPTRGQFSTAVDIRCCTPAARDERAKTMAAAGQDTPHDFVRYS
jgi:hypothetical protein